MVEPLDRSQWASRNTGSLSLRRSPRQLVETVAIAAVLYWAYQRFWPGQQMQAVVEGVAVLIVAYLITPLGEYTINYFRAPTLKLQRRNLELEQAVTALEVERSTLKTALADAQNPHRVMALRSRVKGKLGELVVEGSGLFKVEGTHEQRVAAAENWGTRGRDLIKGAFGSGESALFLSDAGYTFYGDGSEERKLDNWIRGRLQRIGSLIERSDSAPLEDGFTP